MKLPAGVASLAAAAILTATPAHSPAISLVAVAWEPRDVSNHAGQLVVPGFWATWWAPCREGMPMLDRLQDRYASQGAVFIGASAEDADTRNRIKPILEGPRIAFRIGMGATARDMARFGLSTALPSTANRDREGPVAFRSQGPLKRRQLVSRLAHLLSGLRARGPSAPTVPCRNPLPLVKARRITRSAELAWRALRWCRPDRSDRVKAAP